MLKAAKNSLKGTRRRLSVVSDNKLIEGLAALGVNDNENIREAPAAPEAVVSGYAGVTKKGYAPYNPRKRNQDAMIMQENNGTFILGVLDGHGEAGDLVSSYFADRLPARLTHNKNWNTEPTSAMVEEVDRLEKALLSDASIDTEFSGTTAVIAALRGKALSVANIGDSRIIIGQKEGDDPAWSGRGKLGRLRAVEVSRDHKPDRPDEKRRITSKGGRVFAVQFEDGVDGPMRVWLAHMDIPGLAMSRSLGDTVAHTAGVISEPELHTVELSPPDHVIIVASDGLWEFISNQEALDLIADCDDPRKAVDVLVAEANARWLREEQVIDDTTVIVVFLNVRA